MGGRVLVLVAVLCAVHSAEIVDEVPLANNFRQIQPLGEVCS